MSATQSSPRWTLTFDWTSPPLTANQRHHWRKKADITRKVRAAATTAARDIPYLDKIRVGMTWVVRTQHRRDVDNTVPTLKALCDGLVDADIVPDDTPDFMVKTMPEIRYEPTATPHIELWIEAVEPDMPGFEGTRAALDALGANTESGKR